MNKNYRSIYNEVTGTWVAVSEAAKSNGKKTKNTQQALGLVAAGIASGVALLAPSTDAAPRLTLPPQTGLVTDIDLAPRSDAADRSSRAL